VTWIFLLGAGLLAGFINSIAGGGGLITLPAASLIVGVGVTAIGTNKIAGATASLIALIVYAQHGHVDWKNGALFAGTTGAGALIGSRLAPFIPRDAFPWLLAITCPIILYVLWRRDLWLVREAEHNRSVDQGAVALSGFLIGVYDGVWGPGSGTFMFLALMIFGRLPLLTSLAVSKLANTCSAVVALISYGLSGHVLWHRGAVLAVGTLIGGFFGAKQASAKAATIVRPVLAVVVVLLIVRLIADAI
jgi:uncharacterized protein